MLTLDGKTILVTGGTGSLGQVLVRRLLDGAHGTPAKVRVFSRDETKQHYMRMQYLNKPVATDEVIYSNFKRLVEFRIGDVRDYNSVAEAVRDCDIIVSAAALKQVPTCEYFTEEAVKTNILGPFNVIRAVASSNHLVSTVVGVSTDKACKPINVMGMTKAIQERAFLSANLHGGTRYVCVRYGNVLASRGSVVPLFHDQISKGGPLTITDDIMTRFLLTINDAVDVIFAALDGAERGETYIPKIPSARIIDIANVLIAGRPIQINRIGLRPGEKIHEILISEEEGHRTMDRGKYFAIGSDLPELSQRRPPGIQGEYSSALSVIENSDLLALLDKNGLMVPSQPTQELLR